MGRDYRVACTTACVVGAIAGIVCLSIFLHENSKTCDEGYLQYSLKRDFISGLYGYDFSILDSQPTTVAEIKRTGIGSVLIDPSNGTAYSSVTMNKNGIGAFVIPTYDISINSIAGKVGMNILSFINKYTLKLGETIFTTKDTWGFKIVPDKFIMVTSNNIEVCKMNLVYVSLTKTWNVCVKSSLSGTDISLIFAGAASLAIHDAS